MKSSIVHCRYCHEPINRETQDNWVERARNWFYHKDCYEIVLRAKQDIKDNNTKAEQSEETWLDALYDFLRRDIKAPTDWPLILRQWDSFIAKGMTPKGIYLTIKYFYDFKKGDPQKSKGGIGIAPLMYEEAAEYWVKRNEAEAGILAQIERQIKERIEKEGPHIIRQKKQTRKKKKNVDLSSIASSEEWED